MNARVRIAMLTCGWVVLLLSGRSNVSAAEVASQHKGVIVETGGTVEFSPRNSGRWYRAGTNQVLFAGDRLRTMEHSRATVYIPKFGPQRVGPMALLEMPPQPGGGFNLLRGIIYFFHRGKPSDGYIATPYGATLIRGTEFLISVDENSRGQTNTTLILFDGEVELTNTLGRVRLGSGEQGIMALSRSPEKTAVIYAGDAAGRAALVQWALYYPAVLDVRDLNLNAEREAALGESLAAYRAGDLRQALAKHDGVRDSATDEESVYLAALLLSVGNTRDAEERLTTLPANASKPAQAVATSLRRMMEAVQLRALPRVAEPNMASGWLAESYALQSQGDLGGALRAARNATTLSPSFGFAWARVAELEFSFGRIGAATMAVDKSLAVSPRNAQAVALQGFLFAAENNLEAALAAFNRAIALDGALGNAWLGRGLCRIRKGDAAAGIIDLEVAAALEPTRAVLRSYLAKALGDSREFRHAESELAIAKRLDSLDPTAWLYSALLNERGNRINEAIRDLERSQMLNYERGIYRSEPLLHQDIAGRKANLARIYQDAGLVDVSTWEAVRAVNIDYANYAAHLFLANSYDALRDPQQIDLRYETPWLNEYLLANLLAPVGAGILSPTITQLEYSKLLEPDGVGFASATEYTSQGDWTQAAAQYGTFGQSSFSLEEFYRSSNGETRNTDLEQFSVSLTLKHAITSRDRLYGQVIYYDAEGGDLARTYNPDATNRRLRVKETQLPIAVAGYTREWGPESRTMFLAGRLDDMLHVKNPRQEIIIFDREFDEISPGTLNQRYRSDVEIYSIEGQHILQRDKHTFIAGIRYQEGPIEIENLQSRLRSPIPDLQLGAMQSETYDIDRFSTYIYDHWQVARPLLLVAGIAYDNLTYPKNFRAAPVSQGHKTRDQLSPKGGFIWTPLSNTTVRAGYSRSLGGVTFDQSFQLEPSQVAGFNQAFRSLIPESIAGSLAAERFDAAGISLEQKFGSGTYAGLSGEWLESDATRAIGLFEFSPLFRTSTARQTLDYRERSIVLSLYQLVGQEWSTGVRYRFSIADLESRLPALPDTEDFAARQSLESYVHQVRGFVNYNHHSGFFAQVGAVWLMQQNVGYDTGIGDDDFFQVNAHAGYRFLRRRVEARVGVLNINDADYRLSPLNLTGYLPRERTFVTSVRFSF